MFATRFQDFLKNIFRPGRQGGSEPEGTYDTRDTIVQRWLTLDSLTPLKFRLIDGFLGSSKKLEAEFRKDAAVSRICSVAAGLVVPDDVQRLVRKTVLLSRRLISLHGEFGNLIGNKPSRGLKALVVSTIGLIQNALDRSEYVLRSKSFARQVFCFDVSCSASTHAGIGSD